MPQYAFSNPLTGEVREVFQRMHEDHIYQVDGHLWKRLWALPSSSIDSSLDPHSIDSFRKYTSNKRGTAGDIMNLAKECSAARAEKNGGRDEVKEKWFDNYAKERSGAEHEDRTRARTKENLAAKGFNVEW